MEDEQEQHILDRPSPPLLQKYDVFLSFRGSDTRHEFMSHLYHELKVVRGLQTFMDDRELRIGDPISPSLLKAIEQSSVAVVVLSENYASSPWCLEELAKICQCMQDKSRILPLFYKVEPSDVRHRKRKFGDAFTELETSGRHTLKKVEQWKEALKKVANFSGCNSKDYMNEREVVKAIVESVCSKVRPIEFEFVVSSREFELFGATRKAMDDVMKELIDEKITVVGVYGMGGIGKTTLVEQVGVQAQKKGLFRRVIMAVVSQEPNIWNIQGTFADMLGVKLVEDTEIGRASTLVKKIKCENRILIILEDIWNVMKDLKMIGIPSLDELKERNSKILLTTRRKDVCHPMRCQAKIRLGILNEDDSWKLFVNTARKSFDEATDFHVVARKVVRECAGLPVALIAVANALGDKDLVEWEQAAKQLMESKPPNPEDEGDVFKCIKLSYDYLKCNDYKSCFLLCCLFPEDYDIQIEDLLKYGIGKGLFKTSNMQESRAAVHTAVKFLKDSSLLLDAKKDSGCVRMHDVIRDVAISISLSKDNNQQYLVRAGWNLQEWPTDAHECYTAISLMKNDICMLPNDLVLSEVLQILLLQINSFNEIPGDFFQSTKALRVLDLSETSISLLPSSFDLLTSLHTLYLDGLSSISNVSPLGNLKLLVVLSMRDLPLEKLPNEVGQLTKLRMLDFTSECVFIVPSKVMCNLSKLEELYMQCKYLNWGSKAEEIEVEGNIVEASKAEGAGENTKALFVELTGLLRLHILKIVISDARCLPGDVKPSPNWVNFDICISRDQDVIKSSLDSSASPYYSRALTLDTAINTLPKWFIHAVTEKTEKLQYNKCQSLGNILVEYDHGKLHALKYLSVTGPSEILEQLMNASSLVQNQSVFQKLEELHLEKVDFLKLCAGQLPTGSLCNLRLLKVMGTHRLKNALLQSNMLQRLERLETLICVNMGLLQYVFASEGLKPEQVVLTKLTEMRLLDLDNLIQIWNGPAPCAIFCHVKVLVVYRCLKLENLFTSEVARCLGELEDLSVKLCTELQRVIEASEETVNTTISLKNLKKLTLVQLTELKRFYGSTGSATTDEENIEFPSLECSKVERCANFRSPARTTLMKLNVPILSLETGQREAPNINEDYPHHKSRTLALGDNM